ncbi:MAG: cell division protein FtsA, partial [Agathobacter sp.]|nr:cell division protein FtsA [Agathobacter sp.]
SVLAEQDANSTESDNTVTRTSEQMMNQVLDELHDEFAKEAEAPAVPENELPENDIQEEIHEEDSSENTVTVIVNGEPVELSGKDTYIFVDIFTHISFDLQAGKGRAIATVINGRDAQFSEELHEGDKIELYWKEN